VTTQHEFLWANGDKIDIGTLGGPNSGGDIGADFRPNERGQVAGFAQTSIQDPRKLGCFAFPPSLPYTCLGFIWHNGVKTTLPTLGGYIGGAGAINNRGQVTGFAENTTLDASCPPQIPYNQIKAVIWEQGETRELATVARDPDGQGNGINAHGQVVGWSGDCLNINHALLWQNSTVTDLGNLGGTRGNQAFDINNRGQVVGNATLADGTTHGFLWQDGAMTDVGTLPGFAFSFATGINNKGQVGGTSCELEFRNCRAILWQDGVMTDLNSLISPGSSLTLLQARQVNSRGETTGFAFQPSTGETHAYLATPCQANDCEHEFQDAAAAWMQKAERPEIALPENLRSLLRKQLFGRPYRPGPPAP
jgi:probable HAF family extracellular repeat protein